VFENIVVQLQNLHTLGKKVQGIMCGFQIFYPAMLAGVMIDFDFAGDAGKKDASSQPAEAALGWQACQRCQSLYY
jgi:hypothetical protein